MFCMDAGEEKRRTHPRPHNGPSERCVKITGTEGGVAEAVHSPLGGSGEFGEIFFVIGFDLVDQWQISMTCF